MDDRSVAARFHGELRDGDFIFNNVKTLKTGKLTNNWFVRDMPVQRAAQELLQNFFDGVRRTFGTDEERGPASKGGAPVTAMKVMDATTVMRPEMAQDLKGIHTLLLEKGSSYRVFDVEVHDLYAGSLLCHSNGLVMYQRHCSLRDITLLDHSDKGDSSELAGCHGVGMKEGSMVILKHGGDVNMYMPAYRPTGRDDSIIMTGKRWRFMLKPVGGRRRPNDAKAGEKRDAPEEEEDESVSDEHDEQADPRRLIAMEKVFVSYKGDALVTDLRNVSYNPTDALFFHRDVQQLEHRTGHTADDAVFRYILLMGEGVIGTIYNYGMPVCKEGHLKHLRLGLDIHAKLSDRNRKTLADSYRQVKKAITGVLSEECGKQLAVHLLQLCRQPEKDTDLLQLLHGHQDDMRLALVGEARDDYYFRPDSFDEAHVQLLAVLGLTAIPSGHLHHESVAELVAAALKEAPTFGPDTPEQQRLVDTTICYTAYAKAVITSNTYGSQVPNVRCAFMDVPMEHVVVVQHALTVIKVPQRVTDVTRVLDEVFTVLLHFSPSAGKQALVRFDRYFRTRGYDSLADGATDVKMFSTSSLEDELKKVRQPSDEEKAERERKAQEKRQKHEAEKAAKEKAAKEEEAKEKAARDEDENKRKQRKRQKEKQRVERDRQLVIRRQQLMRDLQDPDKPRPSLSKAITRRAGAAAGSGTHGPARIHVDVSDDEDTCTSLPAIREVKVGEWTIMVEQYETLPDTYTAQVLKTFDTVLLGIKTALRMEWKHFFVYIPSSPEVRGYNRGDLIYYNVASVPLRMCRKLKETLVETTVHELIHNVESDHNSRFAQAQYDFMAENIDSLVMLLA